MPIVKPRQKNPDIVKEIDNVLEDTAPDTVTGKVQKDTVLRQKW